jgi:hypothetical protein
MLEEDGQAALALRQTQEALALQEAQDERRRAARVRCAQAHFAQPEAVEVRVVVRRGHLGAWPSPSLHAALCKLCPSWHGEAGEGVQVVGGTAKGQLLVRLPPARVGEALGLEDQVLRLGRAVVELGAVLDPEPVSATLRPDLRPARGWTMRAALVTPTFTKAGEDRAGFEVGRFDEWLLLHMEVLGVSAGQVVRHPQERFYFKGLLCSWGCPVTLRDLTDAQAERVLSCGLGGRRRYGAGCFLLHGDVGVAHVGRAGR